MPPLTAFVTGLTTGLLAGGASCAAAQGGLLLGALRRSNDPRTLRPLTAFLAAKLAAHTALGAALGAFGAVLQPGPTTRAILLIAAAALMLVFALDLLGVHRVLPQPPPSVGRLIRRTRTPALLGVLTVLIPCGVTLSIELLAVTTGSAVTGAVLLAGFVLGTAPLFTLLGYLLRASTRRLVPVTGVVLIAVALWTAISGLRLAGWWPEPSAAIAETNATRIEDGRQIITLRVTDSAFVPATLTATADIPTTLVLRTDRLTGCTRTFVITARDLQRALPPTGETTVELGSPSAGNIDFACGMGMYRGRILFQERGP